MAGEEFVRPEATSPRRTTGVGEATEIGDGEFFVWFYGACGA